MLDGVIVALLTPEKQEGVIDVEGGVRLAQYAANNGVDGLFILGTNGEGIKFSVSERIRFSREIIRSMSKTNVRVCVHTGASTLEDTVLLSRTAVEDGADSIAVVTPCLLPYDGNQLYEYYKTISDSLPEDSKMYLYNIPQRTGNDIPADVFGRLAADCKNIVGMKYSFNDLNKTMEYLAVPGTTVLHGSDIYQMQFLSMGCVGVISGLAGVFPIPFCKVRDYWNSGDIASAQKWQRICFKVGELLKFGNIAVMKEGLRLRGFSFAGTPFFSKEEKAGFGKEFNEINRLISENE